MNPSASRSHRLTVTYVMRGQSFDHLSFRSWKVCKLWLEMLIRRGATEVRIVA